MAHTLSKKESDALLIEIKDRFDYALRVWQPCRDDGDLNMKYVAGDPWDSTDRDDRKQAGRPCISSDELGQYLNQVVNEVRANPRAIKFSPTGNGANDKTARFYADKTREIEYRCNAQMAYTTAFENAVQRYVGWLRITMAFVNERSFLKELSIEPVANPNSILVDPDAQKPDSSDMAYLFCFEQVKRTEFVREYPWATIQSFGPDLIRASQGWVTEEKVRIAEYWKVKTEQKVLVLWQNIDGGTEERLEEQGHPGKGWKARLKRDVDVPSVCQYLTNGVEILKVTPWKGKAIPFVSCYGKILWVDDGSGATRKILAMTTLARDAYMALCWTVSNMLEAVGAITKNPYWVYKGQLDNDDLNEIKKSLHEPVAVLQAKAYLHGETSGTPLPLPQRNPLAADIGSYPAIAEWFRRAIQAAMGMSPLPTSAQRRNEKSGVALKQIEESGQRGSYHFIDHYNDLIRRTGELIEDLMDKAIDTSRDVSIVQPDGTAKTVKVITTGSQDDTGAEDEYSVKGDHAVTVSVGPEFESERQQASDFADALMASQTAIQVMGPETAKDVLALVVKLKNIGPIGEQIAEKISPPKPNGPDGKPIDPQIAERLQMADQVIEKAKEEIEQLQQAIATDEIKGKVDLEKAMIDAKTRIEVAQIQAASRAEQSDVAAKSRVMTTDMQGEADLQILRMESRLKALELAATAREGELERGHEAALASAKAQHEEEMAERSHAQGEESAELGHDRAKELQETEPEAEA